LPRDQSRALPHCLYLDHEALLLLAANDELETIWKGAVVTELR
jgi:hypothetical protein